VNATTLPSVGLRPVIPINFTGSSNAPNRVDLSWQDPASSPAATPIYHKILRTKADASCGCFVPVATIVIGAGTTYSEIVGAGAYRYWVAAGNSGGESPLAGPVTLVVPGTP
jgi:hypothetical protein